jgi:hypothetical protein
LRSVAESVHDILVSGISAYACGAAGNRKAAQAILAQLKKLPADRLVDPYVMALAYSGLGDKAATLDWLERTYREHSVSSPLFSSEPFLLNLHGDPRFQELVRKIGLPAVH